LAVLVAHEAPSYWRPAESILHGTYQELYLDTQRLGRRLGGALHGDETLYQWGEESGLYWYSGKRPPASFLRWSLILGPQAERLTRQTLQSLMARPPDLVIVANRVLEHSGHPVFEWIRSHYVPLRPIEPGERKFFTFFVPTDVSPALARRVLGADPTSLPVSPGTARSNDDRQDS
jgi:hypothetical protein